MIQTPSFITTELDSIDLNAIRQRLQIICSEMKTATPKPARSDQEVAYKCKTQKLMRPKVA